MHQYGYAWEKFYAAVSCLATGREALRERVLDAWVSALERLQAERDLPVGLRDRFNALKAKVTAVEARADEGTLRATLDLLDEADLKEVASEIVALYDRVARHPNNTLDADE